MLIIAAKGGKGEKKGQAEEDDSEDEDTSFCKLCNTSFENPQVVYKYFCTLAYVKQVCLVILLTVQLVRSAEF